MKTTFRIARVPTGPTRTFLVPLPFGRYLAIRRWRNKLLVGTYKR